MRTIRYYETLLFRLHAQYLSSCTPHQTAESQLVTSVVLERGGLSSGRIIPLIQGNIPVIQVK